MTDKRLRLPVGWVVWTFGSIIAFLAIAHVATQSARYHAGMPELYGLVRLFDMGVEANLPTFFSAFQLLVVSLLLAIIGLARRQQGDAAAPQWLLLALIFLLLAMDESAEIHELSVRPFRDFAPWLATGLFYWAWVVPASLLVVVVAWRYAAFVFRYLPPVTRRRTVLGAALFVGGAVGVEMPEARHVQEHGLDNFTYGMFVLVEEVLEKAGILVFLSGLVDYCVRHLGAIELEFTSGTKASAAAGQAGREPAAAFIDTQRPAV